MKQDLKKTIFSLHPLERKVLPYLDIKSIKEISEKSKLSEAEIVMGIQLLAQKKFANYIKEEHTLVHLDKHGEKYAKKDLPEVKLLKELGDEKKAISKINLDKEEIAAAMGEVRRKRLIEVEKGKELILSATPDGKEFLKKATNPLKNFAEPLPIEKLNPKLKEVLTELKKRKGFIKEIKVKKFKHSLTKEGEIIRKEIISKYNNLELIETLSLDMLKTSSWKGKQFRYYDSNVVTSPLSIGRRHPMLEANKIAEEIFVEMGFQEMEGPIVESAFWNMDTLWIPQDHPARDEQDTFYLEGRAEIPKDIEKKVRDMHEKGIKNSHTPIGEWSSDITRKRLLRTHSTATSFRTLYVLGKKLEKGQDINGKYFYNAHNFRNEAIDATHLAEFFQSEGFIIGDNLSLADLMGFIKEFYLKFGIEKVRFKPTYNPYTEPSMEAHYYDPKLKKWYSLINSGIFRPETLEPLGLKGKTIIAWGMGASRLATLLTGAISMRDITGHTCDFEWLQTRPVMTRRITR